MLKKYSATPYVIWSILFIVIPLILIVTYSLSTKNPINGQLVFSFSNYRKFLELKFINVLLKSVTLAFKATIICIILGYPMAMILSKMEAKLQKKLIVLFILPMWMNFLMRTYAWMVILGKNGFINKLLSMVGLNLNLLYTRGAVLLGMVYNFLPFMVLPIFTVLLKIDNNYIEAAEDLGADKLTVFRKIIFPLSMPGLISGITMVFMPAVSTFVISNLLGGGKEVLIGNLIEQQFLVLNNWNFGSALSVILMIFILVFMAFINKFDKDNDDKGGVGLW